LFYMLMVENNPKFRHDNLRLCAVRILDKMLFH
jgi:hypothetical protein